MQYYLACEPLMRAMGGRPVLMQRFPHGARAARSSRSGCPRAAPDWLQTTIVSTPNGTTSRALLLADLAHVVWAVNLGCLGFHVWPYRPTAPSSPTSCASISTRSRASSSPRCAPRAASSTALLDELGIVGYPKTTGNRGLHVYVRLEPRWDSYHVRSAAVAVARELERRRPDVITAAWWKEERGARVFVDFNQNAPHKTVFGAGRCAPVGAGLGAVRWDELDALHPDELTIATVPERLDGWATRGSGSTSSRSRWSRCSACTSAIARRSARRSVAARLSEDARTSRRASRPAGPARTSSIDFVAGEATEAAGAERVGGCSCGEVRYRLSSNRCSRTAATASTVSGRPGAPSSSTS